MADRTVTIWTCDRCERERDMENRGQPLDWVRVLVSNPPNSAEPQRYGDLCVACNSALVRWWDEMKNAPKAEVA